MTDERPSMSPAAKHHLAQIRAQLHTTQARLCTEHHRGGDEVKIEVAQCRHCDYRGPVSEDHTCPCPYSDADCPGHGCSCPPPWGNDHTPSPLCPDHGHLTTPTTDPNGESR